MILYSGSCDAWWRARRQQSLTGGLAASLCALRFGCVRTLMYDDPIVWSWPRICGLLSLLCTDFTQFNSSISRCKHFFSLLKLFHVFTSSQIWHWASCVMWPWLFEPISKGRLLGFYFWVLSRSKQTKRNLIFAGLLERFSQKCMFYKPFLALLHNL